MKHSPIPLLGVLLTLSLLTAFSAQGAQLDQEQLSYTGGTSARNLPGYSIGQSFTAGLSGTLVEIDMGFFNNMSGSGTLSIYAGSGFAGRVLATSTVSVTATNGGVSWNDWSVSVPVTSGSQYTFQFTPGYNMPDPYGVCVGDANSYSGGEQYYGYYGAASVAGFQTDFRTYVATSSSPSSSSTPKPGKYSGTCDMATSIPIAGIASSHKESVTASIDDTGAIYLIDQPSGSILNGIFLTSDTLAVSGTTATVTADREKLRFTIITTSTNGGSGDVSVTETDSYSIRRTGN